MGQLCLTRSALDLPCMFIPAVLDRHYYTVRMWQPSRLQGAKWFLTLRSERWVLPHTRTVVLYLIRTLPDNVFLNASFIPSYQQ